MSTERFKQAFDYFRSIGYSAAQSSGIVGNLVGESNLDIKAVGDGGKAFGIAQWHPDRQANFKRVFGKSIRESTFDEQLQFVGWELNNTEKKAGNLLKNTTNISDATRVFMEKYERPANSSSLNKRVQAASRAYNIGQSGAPSTAIKDILGKIPIPIPGLPVPVTGDQIQAGADYVSDTAESVTNTFEKIIGYIPRAVAIIAGLVLIGLAIATLIGKQDIIVNTVSSVKG